MTMNPNGDKSRKREEKAKVVPKSVGNEASRSPYLPRSFNKEVHSVTLLNTRTTHTHTHVIKYMLGW